MTDRVNAARLIELAEELGVDPVYLEKDFVLTEVIRNYATGPYRDVLVLKGGQALRHIYGSARLSRDVDYVARRRLEFDDLRESLTVRYPRLAFPEKPVGRTAHGFLVRPITYRGPLGNRDSIELEISFRGDLVLDPDLADYRSPFHEPFQVPVMQVNEMITEVKFRPPLVAGGWDRGQLYERVREEAALWEQSLRALVPSYPSFDEALAVVERSLRFLAK
ncbi:MAG: nucleotidyl transferase AbiEii/AbiGii toxin family protein [Chloroflexi bacterium]|nr:nucleotidyl transferase AbiEii/AbiGii toxin family protein [Chloroflexota bacterium]